MTCQIDLWRQTFRAVPLIAILRGVSPKECIEVAQALFDEGFEVLEVPLNSPDPYESIGLLTAAFPEKFIGAGTVLSVDQVARCVDVNCKLIVTPNFNPAVAREVKDADMIYCPGVATPTEAFMAIEAGAHGLKLFPAELVKPSVVKAMRAVLPQSTDLIPVGGIAPGNMGDFIDAGANGFGIGSALYKPGKTLSTIRESARLFLSECAALTG